MTNIDEILIDIRRLFLFENNFNKNIKLNFISALNGYHMINTDSLKESVWESINSLVFLKSDYIIYKTSSGSHQSGCDLYTNFGNFSNKTSKIEKNFCNISSYRLTTVTNNKNNGNINDILTEIEKRSSNFDYYSLLLRKEYCNKIEYKWYSIPKYIDILNPFYYSWKISYGKLKSNKNKIIGWQTNEINGNSMKIVFSMSSQLWIKINIEDIEKYLIADTIINLNQTLNYIDFYNKNKID